VITDEFYDIWVAPSLNENYEISIHNFEFHDLLNLHVMLDLCKDRLKLALGKDTTIDSSRKQTFLQLLEGLGSPPYVCDGKRNPPWRRTYQSSYFAHAASNYCQW
jgi:hypothetical protein